MTLLRVYTEYSMLEGECRLDELTSVASKLSYTACAKTDKGTLAGSLEFSEYAKKNNISPIIGCEISSFLKGEKVNLLLLAINDEGISDLNVFSSFAMTEKSGLVPNNFLSKYSENIVAVAIGFDAIYEKHEGQLQKAKDVIDQLKKDFVHFYVGLERLPDESEEKTFKIYNFCKKELVSCVIANPVYLTCKENEEALALFSFFKNGETTKETSQKQKYFIRPQTELKNLFSHLRGVWENTCRIGKMCKADFETDMLHLPSFPHIDPPGYLRKKALCGLAQMGLSENEEYISRLEEELETIEYMGFADYFLITDDFVSFAKSKDIPVGPGRGSGVGSLVAYCLGITAVDPVKNGLIFQRFLNKERVTMPDFDIDFGDERREEIINYVKEKYGKKHVCAIANYTRFAFRQCIRDVAKYMGFDPGKIIELIPEKTGITVKEALKESPALDSLYKTNPTAKRAIDLCLLLEGRPRAVSPHPSGIIMTKRPVSVHVPLMKLPNDTHDENLCQYSMDTCGKLGLLKIDFLGIKYLTVISKAKNLIKERVGEIYKDRPPQDEKVYQMLSEGKGAGVFQLEGTQMKELLKKMKPKNLDDLTALISLYRPGPKVYIDDYLKGRNGEKEITYPVPQSENALKSTYGCPIYQEQIMQLCRDLAGFSLGHADTVRRAMAKKDEEKMKQEKKAFVDGCEKNGLDRQKSSKLFDDICGFSKYAFNKSHAAAYALLAYETAYLKCIYPKEYFSARLNSVQGQFNKICEYAYEMKKTASPLLPPCINKSKETFSPDESGVRFSLSAIKGVGDINGAKIVKEREKNGIFKSVDDFINRLGGSLSVLAATALAKVGAFDSFGEKRSVLVCLFEENFSSISGSFVSEEQITLSFDTKTYQRKFQKEYTEEEKNSFEKELTGVSFSDSGEKSFETKEKFALYLRLTPYNKENISKVYKKLSSSEKGAIVRIHDSETKKTSQLKDKFFVFSPDLLSYAEDLLGKENVKYTALERKKI